MIYLTSGSRFPIQYSDVFGYLITPRTFGVRGPVRDGKYWALDNDCFNGGLDEAAWLATMELYQPFAATCLFATVPDVLGDAVATLAEFRRYAPSVRSFGYPVALVTQDGLTPNMVPWGEIDALFIGGSDHHKRGREAGALMYEAEQRGKWLHVGRVNGAKTLIRKFWMANSWDGNTVTREPDNACRIIGNAVREARAIKAQRRLL